MKLQLLPSSVFTSETFIFVVGSSAREFAVHKNVFTRLSPYFETLMNGDMVEARNKCARWENTDADAFAKLCQFAYSGNYEEPDVMDPVASNRSINPRKFPILNSSVLETFDDQILNIDLLSTITTQKQWYGPRPRGHKTVKAFVDSPYSDSSSVYFESSTSGLAIQKTHFDWLLCNVKMYILGDTYDIKSLRTLSLEKIHNHLTNLPFRIHFRDLTGAVKYAVVNTREKDELRVLLAHWALCVTPMIWAEVENLLEEVPELNMDYIRVMKDYME
ncbi:hypothetical protein F5X99DRAFT_377302 [Biscogniauxia marginata]|nr:hypothetical protein F5X99DRAFT_377302 [Biscogniauxia marginata]